MNQVEVKRRQIQSFSYVLACINIWVFGKSIGDNGLGYLAAAVLVFALFWVLTGKNLPEHRRYRRWHFRTFTLKIS